MANNKNDAVVANNRSGGAQEEERERERDETWKIDLVKQII